MTTAKTLKKLTAPALTWKEIAPNEFSAQDKPYLVRKYAEGWQVFAVSNGGTDWPIEEPQKTKADALKLASILSYEKELCRAIEAAGDVAGWEVSYCGRSGNVQANDRADDAHEIYATPYFQNQDSGEIETTMTLARVHTGTAPDFAFRYSEPVDTGVRFKGILADDVAAWREAVAKAIADLPALTQQAG